MRPQELTTKIFLDSGDPKETQALLSLLGFLDGQTTNPTLIAKNPIAKKRLEHGEKFTKEEIFQFYREVVSEISHLIPEGSVSVEVYADRTTQAEAMIAEGREMFSWIPNAHIKLPTTEQGLIAAETLVAEGIRVNFTLCFSLEQAAAVYAATRGAKRGQVFISPFVGRLDDRGENGMELIENIIRLYKEGDGHVEVLTASVRTMEHLLYALALKSDIVTAPFPILKDWGEKGMPIPKADFHYKALELKFLPYYNFDLTKNWKDFSLHHDLTDIGMDRFSKDWNTLFPS